MPRRIRRATTAIGLTWVAAGGAQLAGAALGLLDVPTMLVADTLVLAVTGTVAALLERHDKATGARADEVLDAVTMNAAPVDATFAVAFGQGKRVGFQEGWDARGLRANDGASGQIIAFPPATYTAERSAPTADDTTVRLSPDVTALAAGRARHRSAPHPQRRR